MRRIRIARLLVAYNRTSAAVTLDLERDEGRALFRRMAERADFLIESHDRLFGIARSRLYRPNQNQSRAHLCVDNAFRTGWSQGELRLTAI